MQGVKAITYMTTCSDKQVVLTLLCSLLNTVRFGSIAGSRVWESTDESTTGYQVQPCFMEGAV